MPNVWKKHMKILQYKGTSLISWGIRFQTRSKYSHSAIWLDDGTVVEAWTHGVRRVDTPSEDHTPNTEVDIFSINYDFDQAKAQLFALDQIGKKYDYWAIPRFISRRDEPADDKWFCSELVAASCHDGGCDLLHPSMPHGHISPRDIGMSPLLVFERTIVTS
jgi:uncharacterized protein YycO